MDSRLRRKGEKIIWKVMTSAITFEGSREDKKRHGPLSYLNQYLITLLNFFYKFSENF